MTERRVLTGITVLAGIVFFVAVRLRLPALPMGDEPHYLALAQALVKYHSFDPTPVYLHRDYWEYYATEIDPHVGVVDGRAVPFHNVGLPLLIALPFAVAGRAGAHLVTWLCAVATVWHMFRLLRDLRMPVWTAGVVTVAMTFGTTVYVYASMLFVEPVGTLVVLYAVRVALKGWDAGPWRFALASAGVGYLPWVHGRYAIFPVTFAVLFSWRIWTAVGRRRAPYLWALVPMTALVGAQETFNMIMYRSLSPAPGNTGALDDGLFRLSPDRGLLFLAFDGRFGMLSNFPVVVLAVAGILLCLNRAHRDTNAILLATTVPYTILISTFPSWHAGFSPPGRLLSTVVPPLAYYVAVVLRRLPGTLYAIEAAVAYAFTMSALSDVHPLERFRWNSHGGNAPLQRMADLLGTSLPQFVPMARADNRIDPPGEVRFTAWLVATAAVVAFVWWRGRIRAGRKGDGRPMEQDVTPNGSGPVGTTAADGAGRRRDRAGVRS
ncbi:hypothetical protein Val02_12520 [Virgisporangium aliadipatigenens]|uniref:Uncharacterized protein n=1 Tax=Virgisporangium aliadipatigenens TaxID=741659 RepID=A0A8J4DP01_9ACTN|nr:hypothetical protein [Virgisporangium aliadipatigenens]GIJ44366.1 hypothetical protein Val02_12520 [Virgisporangium aliadipatigenens]